MNPARPLFIGGRPAMTSTAMEVRDKFDGSLIDSVALAGEVEIEDAIARAYASREQVAALKPYERKQILLDLVKGIEEQAESLALQLCREAGKPIKDSRGEVTRLIDTFKIAADESLRSSGEVLNLEISPRARGYSGFVKRFPLGLCSFITPFNFPLNLVAHKVAPAIAAGCPFILKPASATPLGALSLGELLTRTNLPPDSWSILPTRAQEAAPLVQDERIAFLSFTGSSDVGWKLKSQAGKKKVALELGGNAACIVDADSDISEVVKRLIFGAFYQSGQSCISVQRILIHESIYETAKKALIAETERLEAGDPKKETTFIGPIIDLDNAIRIEEWIKQAVALGAKLLCGGTRIGSIVRPTLLEGVPLFAKVCCEEVFGPVAILQPFSEWDEALHIVNESRFGLQAGLFTRDIHKIERAWKHLEVGGVIAGDVPSWRVDNMPYGGVKDSGNGREGVRYAMEEMTEPKLLVIRNTND